MCECKTHRRRTARVKTAAPTIFYVQPPHRGRQAPAHYTSRQCPVYA